MSESGPPSVLSIPMATERQYRDMIVRYGRMLHESNSIASPVARVIATRPLFRH